MGLIHRPKRIVLVRHGESVANLDKTVYERTPDHDVPMTPRGHEQAANAGKYLRELFQGEPVRRRWTEWGWTT
jgi:broad specificity phosphatase PhoE